MHGNLRRRLRLLLLVILLRLLLGHLLLLLCQFRRLNVRVHQLLQLLLQRYLMALLLVGQWLLVWLLVLLRLQNGLWLLLHLDLLWHLLEYLLLLLGVDLLLWHHCNIWLLLLRRRLLLLLDLLASCGRDDLIVGDLLRVLIRCQLGRLNVVHRGLLLHRNGRRGDHLWLHRNQLHRIGAVRDGGIRASRMNLRICAVRGEGQTGLGIGIQEVIL